MAHESAVPIADDELSARDTLKALLIQEGYDLAFASDGVEALEKAATLAPDLILLDVMMPGLDGFEVCQRLRADPLLADIPVIMVTALDDRDSRLQGIEAGADDFVSKPFDRVELRARVWTVTRLNRYRRLLLERTKFEWVIERAKDGYLIVDDGDQVRYANPQARLYLGLSPDEDQPIAKTFTESVRKQYRREPQESWETWPQAEIPDAVSSPARYLVRPESPGVRASWWQVDTLRLSSGPDTGWIVCLRDVTTQITRQRDMRGFHSMVSHKLRTLMVGILNDLQKLLTDPKSELSPAEFTKLLGWWFESTQRLYEEILDILAYLDAPGLADPGEMLSISQLPSVIDEIGSNLEIESVAVLCPNDLSNAHILLSRRAIELVLWEILENAKRFHPDQAPSVEVVVSRSNSRAVCIQISDGGLTLLPEELAQMWTPYYQGERHFVNKAPGMGLGLATVAALVWGVGGTCRAHNREEGPGVVIELALPFEEA